MIQYVHDRLCKWGEWVVRGRNIGRNGYPHQTTFARLMPHGGSADWSPLLDVEAEEVEQCVLRLEKARRDLVRKYYTRTVTIAMLAREMGCVEQTIYNRIAIAQQEVMGYLNDLAAGVELPPVQVLMTKQAAAGMFADAA